MTNDDLFFNKLGEEGKEVSNMSAKAAEKTAPNPATTAAPKRGMTLKSVPISLKKVRKVIEDVRAEKRPLTEEELFDLGITKSYLKFLSNAVEGMIEEAEDEE